MLIHRSVDIQVGDYIKIDNAQISKPTTKTHCRGINSFFHYLVKERILAFIYINKKEVSLLHRPKHSFCRWLWTKKYSVYRSIRKKLSQVTKNVFALIFLGNKKANSSLSLALNCNMWGISHFLARSGLHIALLIFMWQLLFSLIPVHITIKRILLISFALVYQLLSWNSISFLRAFLLFIFLHQGYLGSQRTKVPHLFSFICSLILLYNPYQLFFLDFQLSFGLTFALIAFCLPYKPPLRKKMVN